MVHTLFKGIIVKIIAVPVGYVLSLIAVLLPWRIRNKYLDLLGFLVGVALRSKTIVGFFMKIGFKGLEEEDSNLMED